jgi:membrane protein YdbS with pleckstrin-like domain
MWRVDDWFRPVGRDGTPRAPRVPTVRDRRFSAVGLLAAVAVLVVLAATGSENGLSVIARGGLVPLGYAVVQVVFLVRTRHLGWR